MSGPAELPGGDGVPLIVVYFLTVFVPWSLAGLSWGGSL